MYMLMSSSHQHAHKHCCVCHLKSCHVSNFVLSSVLIKPLLCFALLYFWVWLSRWVYIECQQWWRPRLLPSRSNGCVKTETGSEDFCSIMTVVGKKIQKMLLDLHVEKRSSMRRSKNAFGPSCGKRSFVMS
jgi:hypothetical protein